jgi:hypothetical protein
MIGGILGLSSKRVSSVLELLNELWAEYKNFLLEMSKVISFNCESPKNLIEIDREIEEGEFYFVFSLQSTSDTPTTSKQYILQLL